MTQYEALENPTNEQLLKLMNDRGKFRLLSTNSDSDNGLLCYTPKTLPYNENAPLRNTVPYIPLEFSSQGVSISSVIDPELMNQSVVSFVNNRNSTLTEEQLNEYSLIRKELKLEHIRSELCHLGSVVENDVCVSEGVEE